MFAANRDEFLNRPTAPAAFWEDAPELLAGRDLEAGGTWCGITRTGRFGAVTNYRDPSGHKPAAPSRGDLVPGFLRSDDSPAAYLEGLIATADRYNGYNLLLGDAASLCYFSNREGVVRTLRPGLYGLSNHLLDTPWPKVVRAKDAMARLLDDPVLDPEPFFALLADESRAPDEALPATGIDPEWERALSAAFIRIADYGTRTSTVILLDEDGRVSFWERTFSAGTDRPETRAFTFDVQPWDAV